MRDAHKRGENLGLNEDELAFYDALEVNDSAVKVLGDYCPLSGASSTKSFTDTPSASAKRPNVTVLISAYGS